MQNVQSEVLRRTSTQARAYAQENISWRTFCVGEQLQKKSSKQISDGS